MKIGNKTDKSTVANELHELKWNTVWYAVEAVSGLDNIGIVSEAIWDKIDDELFFNFLEFDSINPTYQ